MHCSVLVPFGGSRAASTLGSYLVRPQVKNSVTQRSDAIARGNKWVGDMEGGCGGDGGWGVVMGGLGGTVTRGANDALSTC